jgi:predicted dehydrogenase
LFGLGNYAKTVVIPNVSSHLQIEVVHEVDPLQISKSTGTLVWTTSPNATEHDDTDVFLIAGYHHTHAPLAIEAIRRGAAAVVEKPVVVSRDQLDELLTALQTYQGRMYCCFHKRYLPFNGFVFKDLGIARGEAVSYHCVVYEVPLPPRHWYRWPNSRSRLVSNGCHWIDHFLFLNDFAACERIDVFRADDGTANCSVELVNGAVFTMTLTDRGSERIGVQDHIELRSAKRTVRMVNGSFYEAESETRVLRRVRTNKMGSYRRMYREIARAIGAGKPGDSAMSIERSSRLMLDLEESR